MDSCNKHVEQISFRQCLTFFEDGQLKGWQPASDPLWLKTQSQHFFIAAWLLLHGNMGPTSKNATTNRFGDRKLKNLIKTSLWQAWVWVAWIERGHQIWVQKIYSDKSFESITDSQLKHRPWRSSWTVTPNSIIHPYRLSDLFMNWMSLLERIAEINACNQLTCPINLLWAVRASLRTSAAERLAAPLPTHCC